MNIVVSLKNEGAVMFWAKRGRGEGQGYSLR